MTNDATATPSRLAVTVSHVPLGLLDTPPRSMSSVAVIVKSGLAQLPSEPRLMASTPGGICGAHAAIAVDITDEQAVGFAEEFTRTNKAYGRYAVATPDDEEPSATFAGAAKQ